MQLLSSRISEQTVHVAVFVLRLFSGGLMLPHGINKLTHFETYAAKFVNFMGMGQSLSLGLTIFAELFCAFLIIIGLFTRLATLPLIVVMCVAVFKAHAGDIFGEGEHAFIYVGCYFAILLIGAGRFSVDRYLSKK